jgi:SNF2 family DNA or RNA helicase
MGDSTVELRCRSRRYGLYATRASLQNAGLADEVRVRLERAFAHGTGQALLELGARQIGAALPADLSFWRDFAAAFISRLWHDSEASQHSNEASFFSSRSSLDALALQVALAPEFKGREQLSPAVLLEFEEFLDEALLDLYEQQGTQADVQNILRELNAQWANLGKIHFNLAEQRGDPESPFVFFATFAQALTGSGRIQHTPLYDALQNAEPVRAEGWVSAVLQPITTAAAQCAWLQQQIESLDLYHPIRLTATEAYAFLKDASILEAAGIVVRVPAVWKSASRFKLAASVGERLPSMLGTDALLDFKVEATLDNERLTEADIRALMQGEDGLQLIRGRWVEVKKATLSPLLLKLKRMQKEAEAGISIARAMRLVAGANLDDEQSQATGWGQVTAGPWLSRLLDEMRNPEGLAAITVEPTFIGTLKPHQHIGLRWLYLLHKLGLGALFSDDMGLGKTPTTIALLLTLKRERDEALLADPKASAYPSLLVAPPTLLDNWAQELNKFAPSLKYLIAHNSEESAGEDFRQLKPKDFAGVDLVMVSYSMQGKYPWVKDCPWNLAILDEAQAIKNPETVMARTSKVIKARSRIAITATPVENSLLDLWSILEFANPGLLGTRRQFGAFVRDLNEREDLEPLRRLITPYLLRRLKTDPEIAKDLPKKTEELTYCALTPVQAALYQARVEQFTLDLKTLKGPARKMAIFNSILDFKTICNSAAHYRGDSHWIETESNKLTQLRQIAESCKKNGRKLIVFSQYAQATGPLMHFLRGIFGKPGCMMNGKTRIGKERTELRQQFQTDEETRFFVLTIKTGGVGLNLTAGSVVVHYDRWWNPAVEDQGTDRAHRFGQTEDVLVYKFVCRGTVEERIDALIESKKSLARDVLEVRKSPALHELSNAQILNLVSLDITAAHSALSLAA